ncbi:hypothetical protein CB0940_03365 [Cercospora beticola]|uniref:Spindle pole body component n=1 Tax=Cercospora beticola TaxID=122368 RepID=A0A2G5I3P0_CERBT|nr:hypothetical protein CB0940_03365 [Cercospora beticola]PIA99103.1 hypothetical protein CB0940_03365 [Cercospora beticola]WPB00541.1 hypothetical protein RHO25_005161 [Cercospora beticola]CAK1361241.1 unnamed protein product [Cercospora beticola]
MDDPISLGRPFEAGQLWPKSLLPDLPDEQSIFGKLDSKIEALEALEHDDAGYFSLDLDIPHLGDGDEELSPPPADFERPPSPADEDLAAAEDDLVWNFDPEKDDRPELPRLCTWEYFERKTHAAVDGATYLSEAGPAAFDALTKSFETSIGVLPQDYALRSLCLLALGRSSSLFQWNHDEDKFTAMLEDAVMTGTSLSCSSSLMKDLVAAGTMIVKLRSFANSSRISNVCPAAVALRSCVALILDAVEENISRGVSSVRSALQLQQLVKGPATLLRLLIAMCERTKAFNNDEDFLSLLSEFVQELAEREPQFCAILQSILARVSAPWLEELLADLGLSRQVPGRREAGPDTPVLEHEQRHGFLSADDRDLVRVTKDAVTLLREHSPDHALLVCGSKVISSRLVGMNNHSSQGDYVAKQYEEEAANAMVRSDKPATSAFDEDVSGGEPRDALPWDELHLSELDVLMSEAPGKKATGSEKLYDDVLNVLSANAVESSLELLYTSATLSPIEHFRPVIIVQHRLVSGVLLRQLLRQHELHKQLELQRSFQMLGNGTFAARLSRALFDKDVQSAERKRGVIPTGDDLGLRVGATKDQRWPPASSELQLSLMGLLAEASNSEHTSSAQASVLSFAIRELPEEEIEQVLDPHSIHALDFLKIQYTAQAPLDSVITTISLRHYDQIFRFLLKLLRLLHVTAELPKTAPNSRWEPVDAETLSFAHRARECVTVLADHFMSIGITPPWQILIATITSLETDLQSEDESGTFGAKAAMDIEGLRHMHEACLDRIRTRLFLKKKQQKLYRGIEDVLSSILKCATGLQTETTDTVDRADHERFRQDLVHLLNALAETVEKPAKTTSAMDAEDADMTRVLLSKLDWNGYYTGINHARSTA